MLLPALPQPYRVWHSVTGGVSGDWPHAVVQDAFVAHLNFQGEAELEWSSGSRLLLRSETLWWLRVSHGGLRKAVRRPGTQRHECLTLVFPETWLASLLRNMQGEVPPHFQPLLFPPHASFATHQRRLTEEDRGWARGFMAPHMCEQARQMLDSARLAEFLVREVFSQAPVFQETPLSRTERVARERVEKAKTFLLSRLDEPPALEELARAVGCSAYHLSRVFTQVEGMPLYLWARKARIARAAALIASGRCNVSEAALEVGYKSFSHFSRAFLEEKGVQPSRWVRHLSGTADCVPANAQ